MHESIVKKQDKGNQTNHRSTKKNIQIHLDKNRPNWYFKNVSLIQRKPKYVYDGGCLSYANESNIQPKLKISHPNDEYEKEADEISEKIINGDIFQFPKSYSKNKEETLKELIHPKQKNQQALKVNSSLEIVKRFINNEESIKPKEGGLKETCIRPIAVDVGPKTVPVNTPSEIGMDIETKVIPSSRDPADLKGVEFSEVISQSVDHQGSFSSFPPADSITSGFMSAEGDFMDSHRGPKQLMIERADNHGGDGNISFLQLFMFKIPECGIKNPLVIPNSGFRIKHTIKTGPGTKIEVKTEKSAEKCRFKGKTAEAAPSSTYHEVNIARS